MFPLNFCFLFIIFCLYPQVILYILLCGFPPFYHENTAQLYKQIKKGEYDFPAPYWTDISDSAKDLVKKLLTVDPKQRYTAKQVLSHPWISGSAASTKQFSAAHAKRIMLLQAKRRLRKSVQTIMAINKFYNVLDQLKGASSSPTSPSSSSSSSPVPSSSSSASAKSDDAKH